MARVSSHHELLDRAVSAALLLPALVATQSRAAAASTQTFKVRLGDYRFTPGTYTFYCSEKLLFTKSQRERGMEGASPVHPAQ